jgi:hypothetical protein
MLEMFLMIDSYSYWFRDLPLVEQTLANKQEASKSTRQFFAFEDRRFYKGDRRFIYGDGIPVEGSRNSETLTKRNLSGLFSLP